MKTPRPHSTRGFTLIEMIGVLAIMSIMAAVLVPSVLKSVERAAMKAELQTMENLAESLREYVKVNTVPPTTAIPPAAVNWTKQLAGFANVTSTEIEFTRWGTPRVFVVDPAGAASGSPRALIISSMRNGLALPTAANLSTAARFSDVWDTADSTVPSGASAALWTGWSAATAPFLVVQRVSLQSIIQNAAQAEVETLQSIGDSIRAYYRSTGSLPTLAIPPSVPSWATQLASFAGLSPNQIATSSAGNPRTYIVDPTSGPVTRLMIISSTRSGLPVPTQAILNTSARFSDVWDTAPATIPTGASSSAWSSWTSGTASALLIERLSLTEGLQSYPISLKNASGSPVSYQVFTPSGSSFGGIKDISANSSPPPFNLQPLYTVALYRNPGGSGLDTTYVVSTNGRYLEFDGTTWIAK